MTTQLSVLKAIDNADGNEAITMYTDWSELSTDFDRTYTRNNGETTDEIDYYARCLFQADNNFKIALQFSDGVGIILRLKSGATYINNSTKTPKYLSVSWLSSFPNEDEKLFYPLQITNICEAEGLIHHSKELKMFNKFQQIIQNQPVNWNSDDDKDMIHALKILIQKQLNYDDNQQQQQHTEQTSQYFPEYVSNLVEYFFHHPKTIKICVRNFEALPNLLKNTLFLNDNNSDGDNMPFVGIFKLFPNVTEIIFNEYKLQDVTSTFTKIFNMKWNDREPRMKKNNFLNYHKAEDRIDVFIYKKHVFLTNWI